MRKYFVGVIMILLLMVPIAGASNIFSITKKETASSNFNAEFTHKVFVEYGTMTTCNPCVTANAQLFSIYSSGDLDFNYVTLVWDEGIKRVHNRLKDLGITSVPHVFFDGKFKNLLGAQSNENPYRNAINQSGARTVPDIDLSISTIFKSGGTLKITVNINNNGPDTYNGHLRVYITEIESRWNDNSGKPYHYAALDIPLDTTMSLTAGTATSEKTWLGSFWGFGDITKDNIMVIATLFDPSTDFVVDSTGAKPTTCSSKSIIPSALMPIILEKVMNNYPLLEKLLNL